MKFIRNIIAEKTGATQDDHLRRDNREDVDSVDEDETNLRQVFAALQDDETDEYTDTDDALDPDEAFDVGSDAPRDPPEETNTQAVMRTILHPGPPLSEAAIARLDGENPTGNTATPDGESQTSAFQKIMQRETALPRDQSDMPPPRRLSNPALRAAVTAPRPVSSPSPAISRRTSTPVNSAEPTDAATPEASQTRKKAGRVKTRLLGFGNDFGGDPDVFASGETAAPAAQIKFPVGWIVVVSGPGRGTAFTLVDGVSQIGRGEDQAIRLDFGDTSISRSNHAAIAYDPEQQKFYLGHGGKANLVRLNGNPVLSTEPLVDGAEIRLGETTLRFVGLCGSAFDWGKTEDKEGDNARFG